MPTYVYEVITDEGEEGQLFEVVQKMSDPPLTHHPTTGQSVRRVIQAPHFIHHSEAHAKHLTGDDNLRAKGFTKYVKSGDGTYEKTVGKGPDVIQR